MIVNWFARKKQVENDKSVTFDNSASVNTQKTVTYSTVGQPTGRYMVSIHNPSTVTELTVKVFNIEEDLGGNDRDAYLTSFVVPKAGTTTGTSIDTYSPLIDGMFLAGGVKLVISNNTALGVSDGFTAYVRVREVR